MFCTSAGNSGSVMSMRPVPGSLSSLLHLHNRQRQPMPASMPGTLPNPTMPGSSAVLMPMERQMSMNSNIMGMQGPNLNNPCASPQVPPMHSEAKMRLKAALTHHPAAMSNGNMNTMGHMMEMMSSRQDQTPHHHMHSHPHQHQTLPPHHSYPHQHQHPAHHPHPQPHHQQNHPHHHSHSHLHAHPAHHQTSPHPPLHSGGQAQVSPAAQQMQPTQTIQPPQPTGGRRRRVVDEDPDERRRKFLERNRAAATRCRQKRKVWVMSLEKKAEELTQTNMQLQNEVSMLKNEVAQLKQLLLTHKDCPITAMQKESQGYLSDAHGWMLAPMWRIPVEFRAPDLQESSWAQRCQHSNITLQKGSYKGKHYSPLQRKRYCALTVAQTKRGAGFQGPESSPPASPVPACSQQQVIQHNTITTSSSVSDVVGSSTLTQLASHRTDINPIL
uniref:Cyclic AMP-responsive element-binding protein 5 n=1 Tax=Coturnix japonica TaxID=93934 RepID=A0A8C2TQB4_COTJA